MRIYHVDGIPHRHFFARAEAIKHAREDGDATAVTLCDTGKLDKHKICAMLDGGGWADSQEVVWQKKNKS